MGKFLSFLLGIATGVLIMVALNARTTVDDVVETLSTELSEQQPARKINYFKVRKGNKYIELHTYMHKDSVEILFGKPHEVSTHSLGDDFYEDWTYNYGSYGIISHQFSFINGELKDVTSY